MYRTNIGDPGGGGVRGTVQTLAIQRGSGGPDPPPLSGIYHVLVNKEYVWLATQVNPK